MVGSRTQTGQIEHIPFPLSRVHWKERKGIKRHRSKSLEHPYLPYVLQALLHLLGHMVQMTVQLAQLCGPVPEAYFTLGPTQAF